MCIFRGSLKEVCVFFPRKNGYDDLFKKWIKHIVEINVNIRILTNNLGTNEQNSL